MSTADRFSSQQLMVPKILWAAFLFSQLAFGFVGYMTVFGNPEFVAPSGDPIVAYVIVGVGTLIPLLAPLITPLLARSMRQQAPQGGAASNDLARVFTPFLLDLALRETGGIFALVVLFLTGDLTLWAIPATTAFALLLLAYPSSKRLEAWL